MTKIGHRIINSDYFLYFISFYKFCDLNFKLKAQRNAEECDSPKNRSY